jgi:PadR family transcriptional regulator, regulatory protein PadR
MDSYVGNGGAWIAPFDSFVADQRDHPQQPRHMRCDQKAFRWDMKRSNGLCRPFVLLALYVFVVVEPFDEAQGMPAIADCGCGMTREALGEFEHMVLLAILHLGDGVYGVPIVDEIQRRTGRTVAPAAVYVTLRRLEQKRLLTSWMSDSTPERGGKSRRCVKITGAGLESLRESRKVLDRMWKGLDPKLRGAQ